jgi:hypothetical protein
MLSPSICLGNFLYLAIYCKKGTYCDSAFPSLTNCVVVSYWDDKEQTDSVMRKDENGTLWMHTGDEAMLDSDGYLRGAFTPLPVTTC